MTKPKILVLCGGNEEEHEISLKSGANITAGLRSAGYQVTVADPIDPALDKLVTDHDVVLPILHGGIGENGVIQRQLEELGAAYLGSSSTTCEVTIDKASYKELLSVNGYLTPNWQVVDRAGFEKSGLRQSSYVLKPISGGSSIDMLVVHNPDHQFVPSEQFDELFGRHERMLLEELIEGEEVTVGVLGEVALPVIKIVPPQGEEFDFENKYNGKSLEIVNPESISVSVQKETQEIALATHKLLGCRHLSRTDVIIAENGSIYILEINTMPGMTEQSLFPKAAEASGYNLSELCDYFVKLAVAN